MRYTVLISMFCLAQLLSAQGYLDNDPRWGVRSVCAVQAPCIATDTYLYHTAGDSVIEGVLWTKVLRQGNVHYLWQAPPPAAPGCSGNVTYGPDEHGVYLIRQDGRQLRIWADEMDGLLYDFDLDVGSTLPLSWNNWNDDITVVAVDSVLIGGSMRARFELANSWAQYLIEGVGTSHGLFEPVSNFLECGYELLCYGLGNVAYYPGTGSCELIMALPQNVGPKVTIGPLLASDVLQVEGTGALGGIRVLDASGRVVLTVNAPERTALIDVSALPAGPYLITVQGDLPRHFNVIH